MQEQDKKKLQSLQALCAGREYCCSDILSKALKLTDGNKDLSEEILEELKKEGYVDDSRYAAAFAGDKSVLSGWGPVKIKYALRRKGLEESIVSEAIAALDNGKGKEKMERVLKDKLRSLAKEDPNSRGKLIRFALSRGYLYDDIMDFLSGIQSDE